MNHEDESVSFLQIAVDNPTVPAESTFLHWLGGISKHIPLAAGNLTLRVVSSTESRRLNKQFRDQDKPTNVLSFPSELPADIEPDYLGDIIICAAIVEHEAGDQNKALDAHWAHMLVHGILHLKGYDHVQETAAQEMESLEIKILRQLGYPNPYAEV